MRTFISLFLSWLRHLLLFLTGPSPTPSRSFIPSPPKWHRLLGQALSIRQRAYLAMLFLGLLTPTVSQAQLGLPSLLQICPGQSINLPLSLSALTGTGAITVSAVTSNPAGLSAIVNSNSGILIAASPTLAPGTYNLAVTATTPGIPAITIGPITIPAVPGLTVGPVNVPITVPAVPVLTPGSLVGATIGSVLNLGTCSLGGTLSYTVLSGTLTGQTGTGGTSLLLTPALSGQQVSVACTGVGSCTPVATTITLPSVATALNLLGVPPSICVGAPLSLTLLPTGIDLSAVGLTVTASTPTGALTVSALGPDGALTISGGNLTVGNNVPVTVALNLGGVSLASAVVNLNILPPDSFTPNPLLGSTTVGSILNLGTCALGGTLSYTVLSGSLTGTTGTGGLTLDAALNGQQIAVSCTGPCSSSATTLALPNVATALGVLGVPSSICVNSAPLSLTLLPTGLDLSALTALGLTASASTPAGALTVSALGADGVIAISGSNLTVGNNVPVTISLGLGSTTLVSTTINLNILPEATFTPGSLSGTLIGSVLNLGSCSTGILSYTLADGSTGTGSLSLTAALAGQNVTVACEGPGVCPSAPSLITLPSITPTLNLGGLPNSVCVDLPINLNLLPTGFDLTNPLLAITASTTSGTLAISALGPNGALTINGGQLTVGEDQPVTIAISLLGTPLASANFTIDVVQPAIPNQPLPQSLTATVGNVLSLSGLCPTGTLVNLSNLTDQTGIISIPTTTAGVQSLSILCNDNGCLSPIRVVETTVLPLLFNVLSNEPVCLNQPLSLTVLPANFGITDPLVSISVTGPVGLSATAVDPNGVLTITGLASGVNNLSVVASIAGTPVATVGITANAIPVPNPVAVASLTVLEGTTLSLTALCPTAVVSTTGLGGTILPLLTLPPTTVGVQVLPLLCAGPSSCVSPITSVTVITVPVPPIGLNPSSLQVCVGDPLSLTVTGLEAITLPFGLSLVGAPTAAVSVLNNVLTITGLPAGTVSLTVNAGLTIAGIPVIASQVVTVTVFDVPAAPTVVTQGGSTYPAGVSSLSVTQNSADVLFNASCTTGTLSYTSNTGVVGSSNVITVTTAATGVFSYSAVCVNGACTSPATVVSVTVVAPVANQNPVVAAAIPDQTGTVGVAYSFTIPAGTFTDPEGQSLTLAVANLPNGLGFDPATNLISGTPTTAQSNVVVVTATDPQGGTASTTFNFTVNAAPNQNPVVAAAIPDQTGTVGVAYSFTIPAGTFTDPEGQSLTLAVANLPNGLGFDPATNLISGTPTTAQSNVVTVTATDPQGGTASTTFNFTIQPNLAPVLSQSLTSPVNATVGVGVTIQTAYAFSDPEGLPLSFSSATLPAALSINPATGVITGAPSTSGTYGVTITATDSQGQTVSGNFTLNVVPQPTANQAPIVANAIPPQSGTVGVGVNVPIPGNTFTDPNGDPITVTVSTLPPGLTFDPSTTAIVGTPTTPGVTQVTVTGTDPSGASVSTSFPFTIQPNLAPVLSQSLTSPVNATVGVGVSIQTAYAFSDPEGLPLSFSSATLPAALSINPATGLITGAPSASGTYGVTISATDSQGQTVSGTFTLNVVPQPVANQAPIVAATIPPQSGTVGVGVNFPIPAGTFTDPNGDPITVTVSTLPPGLSFDSSTTAIVGTPTTPGVTQVTVTGTDPGGASVSTSFPFTIQPNLAPVLSQSLVSPISATVGVGVSIQTAYAFSDPEGLPLSFSSATLPAALSIDPATGVITGAPSASGTYGVTITATDSQGQMVSGTFTLNVVPQPVANQAPTVANAIPPQSGTVGVGVNFPIPAGTFSDPNGDPITVSVTNLPPGLTFDPSTTAIVGTPTTPGVTQVTVTGTDPSGASVSTSFPFTIQPNQAPVLSQSLTSPINATVGVGVSIQTAYAFSDPEGLPLSFSSATLPAALSINPATGVITGAPSASGTYGVTITATDSQGQTVSGNFTLNVVPATVPNQAPTVANAIPPQSGTVGVGVNFPIPAGTFTDPNGDPITVTVSTLPPGLSFDPGTTAIVGTPTTPGVTQVTVTGTDPSGASVSTSFPFTIQPNLAPVLSQSLTSPVNATVGVGVTIQTAYAFSDPEGLPLSFSSATLPAALSINPATGVITGAPSASGTYGVTITATDSQGQTVSGNFTLNVVPATVPNQAPTVANAIPPQSGTVGVGVNFPIPAGTFTDPNGDPITVSVSTLPPGLTFDPSTTAIVGTPTTPGVTQVTVTGTDPSGASVSTSFPFTIQPNLAPVLSQSLTSPVNATVGVGVSIQTAYAFSDPEGLPLSFSSATLPAALSINPATGVITGAPSASGTYGVTITATDSQGQTVSGNFTLNVMPQPTINLSPVLSQSLTSPVNATVGVGVNIPTSYAFSDPNGDVLTFSSPNLPTALSINASTGLITGAPSTSGTFGVTVVVSDPQGQTASGSFNLVVSPQPVANQAPIVANVIPSQTGTVGIPVNYVIPPGTFVDPNGDPITVTVVNLPPGLTFDPGTTAIVGTPTTPGVTQVTVTGTDPGGASVSTTFPFTIVPATPGNQPPVVANPIPPQSGTVGVGVNFPIPGNTFTDPNGDPIVVTVGTLPPGLTFDPGTTAIVGTPTTPGTTTVTVTATDPSGSSVTTTFPFTVVPAQTAPFAIVGVTPIDCQTVTAGLRTFTFTPQYAGLNGQPILFSVVNETAPTYAAGPYTLNLYTDNPVITLRAEQTGSPAVTFTLNWLTICTNGSGNQPPVVANPIPPQSGTVGVGVNFPIPGNTFTDPNGDPIVVTVGTLPPGLTFNPSLTAIVGTPTTPGTTTVTVTATDPSGATVVTTFPFTVVPATPGNQSPIVVTPIGPQSGTVGVGFSLVIPATTFSDPEGQPLTVSVSNLPPGLTFNPSLTAIVGTPTTPGTTVVAVTATDPSGGSVSTSFVLTIRPATVQPPLNCGSNLDGTPLRATMPMYDCEQIRTTGFIQFTAEGGNPNGGPIEFLAYGITGWTTSCTETIDLEARTFCDAPPIEIQIRQLVNGTYVYGTSYIFDIRRACPSPGCPSLPNPNRAPVVNAGIPDQYARVGQIFDYDIQPNAFTDPDGDALLYTISPRLPDSFTYSTGHFHALPLEPATYTISVMARDNSGAAVMTTFRIFVLPSNDPTPQPPVTTPQPPVTPPVAGNCGSNSLDGSTLRATMPVYDCAQLTTTGAIRFTAMGGNPNGGAVEFRAVGVTDWTTTCNANLDQGIRTACDAAAISIQVRQLVNGSYVYGQPFTFHIRQACPIAGCSATYVANPRLAAPGFTELPLTVTVLGNPVEGESVEIEVRGAEGKPVRMLMSNSNGVPVSEQVIDNAQATERQTLKLGTTGGVYLLRVSTPTDVKTVKVVKK